MILPDWRFVKKTLQYAVGRGDYHVLVHVLIRLAFVSVQLFPVTDTVCLFV